jgi:hypothetical protein
MSYAEETRSRHEKSVSSEGELEMMLPQAIELAMKGIPKSQADRLLRSLKKLLNAAHSIGASAAYVYAAERHLTASAMLDQAHEHLDSVEKDVTYSAEQMEAFVSGLTSR